MATHRHFQPAAQRGAVNRRYQGLLHIVKGILGFHEAGAAALHLVEFGNIGAGDEGPPGADQQDGFGVRILGRHVQRRNQAVAHRHVQGVYGGIVQSDDGDIAFARKIGDDIDGGHGGSR